MTLDEINALPPGLFAARYGGLFEHSPWVAERAAARRPFPDLADGLAGTVEALDAEDQLRLIRAHPELAGKAALARELTPASAAEQGSAGLDRLSEEEFGRFHALNEAYRQRFGFPFVICVRRTDKAGVLAAMERRLSNTREEEVAASAREIGHIVRLRLEAAA